MSEWKGTYWNTRLVEKKSTWKSQLDYMNYFSIQFVVHEVHYDKDNNIVAWSENPISLSFSDYEDAKGTIKHIKDALKRTVLRYEGDKLVDTGKLIKQYKDEELTNYNPEELFNKYVKEE